MDDKRRDSRPPVVVDSTSDHRTTRAIDLNEIRFKDLDDAGQRVLDLRDRVSREDDDVEEHMSFPDDDDDLPTVESSKDLPPWTDPPTGEVPAAVLGDKDPTQITDPGSWQFKDLGQASRLGDTHDVRSEFDSVDYDPFADHPDDSRYDDVVAEPPHFEPTAEPEPHTSFSADAAEAFKKSSLTQRVGTGAIFAALAIAAFVAGPVWTLILATAIMLLAGVEYFDALRKVGYRPATLLGLVSVGAAMIGVYQRGEAAIPLVLVLAAVFIFAWYLVGIIDEAPTANSAVTLLGVVWIGIFGSYASLMLREPSDRGIAFIIGGVLCVIAYDTAAYVGGTLFGRRLMIPRISPGKTWEGLAFGTVAAVVVGGLVGSVLSPWSVVAGLTLGLVVAIVSPLGDLAESMVKRDLGLKDMGRLLPGHGGIFDRFDALLFVLPATYYVARMFELV